VAQQMATRGTGLAEVIARQLSGGGVAGAPPAGGAAAAAGIAAGADKLAALNPGLSAAGAAGNAKGMEAANSAALQMSTLALAKLNLDMQTMATAPSTPAAPTFDVEPLSLDEEAWSEPHAVHSTHEIPQRIPSVTTAAAAAPAGSASLAQTGGFVNRIWNHAVDAARSIGVPPQFMVGQAALESGWGKHEIRTADGGASHNLFGVKAGRGWNGPSVEKTTTEFVNGVAQKTTAKFRVYSSYGEAFKDYAKLIGGNPRYAGVLSQAQDARGFARGLQQAGYATDPAYADKLVRVINSTTLRQSLAYAPPEPVQILARR